MEKLGQLRSRDEWDLIVVDTPPSRSALDFLDAPKRLGSFLDGKLIRVLMAPAKVGGRAGMKFLNVGMSMMTGVLGKLLGGQLLRDVQTFVAAMDTMFGGFRTRADATYRLLQAPGTAFLVVASPERDALREAAYFVERLAAEQMPLAGLVLNRVHTSDAAHLSAERAMAAAEALDETDALEDPSPDLESEPEPELESPDQPEATSAADETEAPDADEAQGKGSSVDDDAETAADAENLGHAGMTEAIRGKAENRTSVDSSVSGSPPGSSTARGTSPDPYAVDRLTSGLLKLHAERMRLLAREQRTRDRFTALHPEVKVVEVTALPGDVHDLAGLRDIGDRMAVQPPETD